MGRTRAPAVLTGLRELAKADDLGRPPAGSAIERFAFWKDLEDHHPASVR